MCDREDEPSSWTQNTGYRAQRRIEVRNVHQGQVTDQPIEGLLRKLRQTPGIIAHIIYSPRLVSLVTPGEVEHPFRDIHADDDGPQPGQASTEDALTACEVADPMAIYLACQIQNSRDREVLKTAEGSATKSFVVPVGDVVVGRPAHAAPFRTGRPTASSAGRRSALLSASRALRRGRPAWRGRRVRLSPRGWVGCPAPDRLRGWRGGARRAPAPRR